jgi:hypothetical protein
MVPKEKDALEHSKSQVTCEKLDSQFHIRNYGGKRQWTDTIKLLEKRISTKKSIYNQIVLRNEEESKISPSK